MAIKRHARSMTTLIGTAVWLLALTSPLALAEEKPPEPVTDREGGVGASWWFAGGSSPSARSAKFRLRATPNQRSAA